MIPKALATLTGQALADTSDRCIEDQAVIDKILTYLIKKGALPPPPELLPAAGPRQARTGLPGPGISHRQSLHTSVTKGQVARWLDA